MGGRPIDATPICFPCSRTEQIPRCPGERTVELRRVFATVPILEPKCISLAHSSDTRRAPAYGFLESPGTMHPRIADACVILPLLHSCAAADGADNTRAARNDGIGAPFPAKAALEHPIATVCALFDSCCAILLADASQMALKRASPLSILLMVCRFPDAICPRLTQFSVAAGPNDFILFPVREFSALTLKQERIRAIAWWLLEPEKPCS